ncbi:hypothetical protein Tamer19_62420 [Cupriavidus sp. TA19]|uniref:hypothetical protein n=1 Tax=Cupriavidus sp. TA19 TaxID=701108 RepID=UPI00272944CE|nr:hypothetical protein [Cupriavidus sp. TA19]GLC96833.1 hypothetical protein Tamer19_62420 [Cupriavidus sp. TA19]
MDAAALDALKYVVTVLLSAGAAYGGIRADMRNMRRDIERANDRMDNHLQGHR